VKLRLYPPDCIEIIESENVNLGYTDSVGCTFLHYAAGSGRLDIVKALVTKGADVSAKNKINETPLHRSAARGHEEVVKYLVSQNANLHAFDDNNQKPADVAQPNCLPYLRPLPPPGTVPDAGYEGASNHNDTPTDPEALHDADDD